MKRTERDLKWERVLEQYKRLVTNGRVFLTDSQEEFVDEVNKRCFGRVYMNQPTDHIVNKLYKMTLPESEDVRSN